MNQNIIFSLLFVYVLTIVSTVDSFVSNTLKIRNFALIRLQIRSIQSTNIFHSGKPATERLLKPEKVHVSLSNCDQYAEKPIHIRIGGKWFGPIIRYINNFIVGIVFTIILRIRNKFIVKRREILLNAVFHRPKGSGLLTVSNHQSMLDDPGMWAAALPFWRLSPEKLRWSLCTEDVFFNNKYLTAILEAGNVVPLDRRGPIDQPLLRRFNERLSVGAWCHIFPEGRIFQSWRFKPVDQPDLDLSNSPASPQLPAILGPLKLGVGKLVAHSPPSTVVLPIYHRGMDHVLPERRIAGLPQLRFQAPELFKVQGQSPSSDQLFEAAKKDRRKRISMCSPLSAVPSSGRRVQMWIGQPMNFSAELAEFYTQYPDHPDLMVQSDGSGWRTSLPTIALYERITARIQAALLALADEADAEAA